MRDYCSATARCTLHPDRLAVEAVTAADGSPLPVCHDCSNLAQGILAAAAHLSPARKPVPSSRPLAPSDDARRAPSSPASSSLPLERGPLTVSVATVLSGATRDSHRLHDAVLAEVRRRRPPPGPDDPLPTLAELSRDVNGAAWRLLYHHLAEDAEAAEKAPGGQDVPGQEAPGTAPRPRAGRGGPPPMSLAERLLERGEECRHCGEFAEVIFMGWPVCSACVQLRRDELTAVITIHTLARAAAKARRATERARPPDAVAGPDTGGEEGAGPDGAPRPSVIGPAPAPAVGGAPGAAQSEPAPEGPHRIAAAPPRPASTDSVYLKVVDLMVDLLRTPERLPRGRLTALAVQAERDRLLGLNPREADAERLHRLFRTISERTSRQRTGRRVVYSDAVADATARLESENGPGPGAQDASPTP
jgi:hypothetical protein